MGRPKAQLPLPDGHTLLSRLIRTLANGGTSRIVVVARPEHAADLAACAAPAALAPEVVVNEDPDRGQLSSLQAGLLALGPDAPAALVTLVDVPFVAPQTVAALLAAWRRTAAPLVRPVRGGRHGHPMLVARAVMDDLLRAPIAARGGARLVVSRYAGAAVELAVDDEGAFVDVDTPEEYERLVRRFAR